MTTYKTVDKLLEENKVLAFQFRYDNSQEVLEATLYGPVTPTKETIELPIRFYPTERQRNYLAIISAAMELDNNFTVTKPLEDSDYLEGILILDNPVYKLDKLKTPKGVLKVIVVDALVGSEKDVAIKVSMVVSNAPVIGIHSMYMGKKLTKNVLAQYIYYSLAGKLDRTPKFIRAVSGPIEARIYPDNTLDNILVVNSNLVIRGKGNSTLGLDMATLKGEVKMTSSGYVIVLTDRKGNEVDIYV